MENIRLELKFRNNLILKKIEESFVSIAKFCQKHHLCPSTIGRYISFKESPVTIRKGDIKALNGFYWEKTAIDLAKALEVSLFDIFPQELWDKRKNKYEIELDSSNLLSYSDFKNYTISNDTPETNIIKSETNKGLKQALLTLNPRKNIILKKRFGFDGPELTYEEIANKFGVTRERIRQIEAKAFRKLRHSSRLKLINEP